MEELGKSAKDCGPCLFKGGETEALQRLDLMTKKSVRKKYVLLKLLSYM
jgi:hypothetical protein